MMIDHGQLVDDGKIEVVIMIEMDIVGTEMTEAVMEMVDVVRVVEIVEEEMMEEAMVEMVEKEVAMVEMM